jgi:L,D-transpeptidase ErfK/SrfK
LYADTAYGGGIGFLYGKQKTVTVKRGDSLLSIARRGNTDPVTLTRMNDLKAGKRIVPGTKLKVPGRYILPARLHAGIVLNIPERAVYLFKGGKVVGRYPVAVGLRSWPTPTGEFDIATMIKNPVWITPEEMVKREGAAPGAVSSGQKNPLGDRWMGWCESVESDSEVGFHGTNDLNSIGKLASHACVRLYPEHARQMYDQVYRGMKVVSLYEPIKVARDGNTYYLSVSPDIYGKKVVSVERARELLRRAGAKHPDLKRVQAIINRQDGAPHIVPEEAAHPLAESIP